ncbi:thermonuclease family protein [Thermodesulfobacteriota bacterium]
MLLSKPFHIALLFLLFLWCSTAFAWSGKVVSVNEGDMITVVKNGRHITVRLFGIDCPEKNQAFGEEAKKFTAAMTAGKTVAIEEVSRERFDRLVGIVRVDGRCINEELVRAGLAWARVKYCKKMICATWPALEDKARQARIGLWIAPNPIPPWEWGKGTTKNDHK